MKFGVAFTTENDTEMKELSLQNCRIDGRYDVLNFLSRGSYSEIFVARDSSAATTSPHNIVVIKALNVFLQGDLDNDLEQTLVENFQNEAVALDRVRHPNIIARLGHGTARDIRNTVFHYLILEYLSGGDLAQFIKKQLPTFTQAVDFLEQICAGLGHAHKCGIIHRDIKPQNLLLTKDGKVVKLCDFGVAKLNVSDEPITRVGTNLYAPPEHSPAFIDTQGGLHLTELTPASDIYSLAKTAYVLLTGESPRKFSNQTITDLPVQFQHQPWANSVLRLLQKATQFNPKLRHQSVTEFWQELLKIKLEVVETETEDETKIASRINLQPSPSFSSGFSPNVPLQAKFSTSRDFNFPQNAPIKPQAVVKIKEQPMYQPPQTLSEVNNLKTLPEIIQPKKKSKFLRRAATFVVLIGIFAGALFATQNYLQTGRFFPKFQNPLKQTVGTANSDVNIRPTAGIEQDKIGLVPKGSTVKVIAVKDNWMEIDIIEASRPKDSAGDAEHGWVNRRYIDIQE
jgi:eukaryotic-like serine/threonine-protein kinase